MNQTLGKSDSGHILIVDDVPENLRLLSDILRLEGHQVRATTSGPLALDAARLEKPALVLLDIVMPLMDGYEVCRRFKADDQLADIPIVFVSSLDDAEVRTKCFEVGGADYLSKPLAETEVVARIGTHLAVQRTHAELEVRVCQRTEELARSQIRAQELFEHTPVGMIEEDFSSVKSALDELRSQGVRDIEDYVDQNPDKLAPLMALVRILDVNQAAVRLSSAPDKAHMLANFGETLTGRSREVFRSELATIWNGIPRFSYETKTRTFNNELKDVDVWWAVAPGSHEDYSRVLVSFTDITKRKQNEIEVLQKNRSMELLNRVATAANAALIVDDAIQVAIDEICAYTCWPVGHAYIMGDDGTGELVSTKLWHLDSPDDFDVFRRVTERTRFPPGIGLPGRVLVSMEPLWIINVVNDPNFPRAKAVDEIGVRAGFAIPVLVEGQVFVVLEFFSRDEVAPDDQMLDLMAKVSTQLGIVLKRNLAEQALNSSEQRLATILEITPEAIISIDESQIITLFNEGAEATFGYTASEIVGESLDMIIPARNREEHRSHVENFGRSADRSRSMAGRTLITGLHKNGTEFPAEASLAKANLDGRLVYIVLIRDVSERLQADKERQDLERKLQQSQKMETIGALAGGIAHDFNNILVPIVGYSQMLQSSWDDAEKVRHYATRIEKAGSRARDLVHQILTFSRQTEPHTEILSIPALLQEILEFIRSTTPSNITIVVEIDDACPVTLADPTQIHQVIMNLCANAVQAMEGKGGELRVSVQPFEVGKEFPQPRTKLGEGSYIRISIEDTGCGMDKSVQDRIFDPFFTTKSKGTGMGLATVHGIVLAHGGDITVYSEPQLGTTFSVYIPCTEGSLDAKEAANQIVNRGCERILLVDDETENTAMMSDMLSGLGYRTSCFNDSQAAFDAVASDPGNFDLVITDFTMPVMTGDELAMKIHSVRAELPVILMTGFNVISTEEMVKKVGVKHVLHKPFTVQKVSQLVRRTLDSGSCPTQAN